MSKSKCENGTIGVRHCDFYCPTVYMRVKHKCAKYKNNSCGNSFLALNEENVGCQADRLLADL